MFQDVAEIIAHPFIAVVVLIALIFDFTNGFHDAANSIATIVATKVLKPFQAVVWAAWWNFIAAWFFGVAIANAVANWVNKEFITPEVIASALIGAIVWNLITWFKGLPSSSSHALLGAFAGAAITYAGTAQGVMHMDQVMIVVIFIFVSPLIGMVISLLLSRLVRWITKTGGDHPTVLTKAIQLATSAAYSLGHGTNDAQKTMGIIAALLYTSIWKTEQSAFEAGAATFPFWIVIVCHAAMALGTLFGGWRIVNTMAYHITNDLTPRSGACAETAAAISLFISAKFGIPVSTTLAINGALVGVGIEDKSRGVFWKTIKQIAAAWLLTIPASAILAALVYLIFHFL